MSAFITMMTPMTDQECLVEALAALGLPRQQIEVSATPLTLRGYQQGRQAHVILRKELTGDLWNDIGFLQTPTGYKAVLSNDYQRYGTEWLSRVGTQYQQQVRLKEARLAELDRQAREREAQQRELERQKLVEAQRQAIEEKAKKLGYMVKESREADKIRLVLVKRTY
ncbi:MAG: hypothetical protein ACKO6N_00235 [Myxococcota bacterium]